MFRNILLSLFLVLATFSVCLGGRVNPRHKSQPLLRLASPLGASVLSKEVRNVLVMVSRDEDDGVGNEDDNDGEGDDDIVGNNKKSLQGDDAEDDDGNRKFIKYVRKRLSKRRFRKCIPKARKSNRGENSNIEDDGDDEDDDSDDGLWYELKQCIGRRMGKRKIKMIFTGI